MPGPAQWLEQVVTCPADGAGLQWEDDAFGCEACERRYPVLDSVLELLPDAFRDLSPEAVAGDRTREWLAGELAWWEAYHPKDSGRPAHPRAGMRGRSRERNLLRHVRGRVGPSPLVAEMGAGTSRTVAGLWPPAHGGIRYVATDLSEVALRAGARALGPRASAVRCEGASWPFAADSLDVVLVLGVLHHLPDWRTALRRACESVRPGGFVLLHEVIYKPRILASRRDAGLCDGWTSPHEGTVSKESLRELLEERGTIERWRPEGTPLRFLLAYYGDLHERFEENPALTVAMDLLDQAFGRTLGALAPSLGFSEVTCLWRKPDRPRVRGSTTPSAPRSR